MKIFINSDVDACVERLKVRNLCIPGYTPEEIIVRCEVVDRKNAVTVMKSRFRADAVVDSLANNASPKKLAPLDATMQHTPEEIIMRC
jgi:uridine kinase